MNAPRRGLVATVLCAVITCPLAAQEGGKELKGWGVPIDPEGNCEFRHDGDKLTISVPGSLHDLSREAGDMSAPRVLREVEGDFVAGVKVVGTLDNAGAKTSERYIAYHGAGLLLWVSDDTYIRLERCAIPRAKGITRHINFDFRKDARNQGTHPKDIENQPTFLRLERRGNRVLGFFSYDGERWTPLEPWELELPRKLKIGVAAVSTSSDPLKAEFEGFAVHQPKPEDPAR